MTCRTDACCQGREPCPTPDECCDEPLTDPDYMRALTALTGVLALAFIAGGLIWLVYSILPVLRAHFV